MEKVWKTQHSLASKRRVSPTNVPSDTTGAATSGTRLGRHGPDGAPLPLRARRAIAVARKNRRVKASHVFLARVVVDTEMESKGRGPRPAGAVTIGAEKIVGSSCTCRVEATGSEPRARTVSLARRYCYYVRVAQVFWLRLNLTTAGLT